MFAYLLTILALVGHAVSHAWLPFTAVGGSLLYFGARRPAWQAIFPVAMLALSDYYTTTHVYNFPFAIQSYLVTWIWYAAIIALGAILLRSRTTVLRVASAVLLSATSFFVVSNYVCWAVPGLYPHTFAGLMACYTAALPFYRNDLVSTAIVAGLTFGIPAAMRQEIFRKHRVTMNGK